MDSSCSMELFETMPRDELVHLLRVLETPDPLNAPPPDDELLTKFLEGTLVEGDEGYVRLMFAYQTWRVRLVQLAPPLS